MSKPDNAKNHRGEAGADRRDRRAEALRLNLARRKAQKRARDDAAPSPEAPAARPIGEVVGRPNRSRP